MNPKEKKSSRAYNDLLNEMQEKRIRRRSFRKGSYAITGIATLLLIAGSIGITLEPAPREAPMSPLHLHRALYFSALNLSVVINSSPAFCRSNCKLGQRRYFLVIADEDKKEECDSIPPIERILSESQTCKEGDSEFEVVGENGTTGLTWAPEDGEYYVGIGTLGENNPAGEGFKLDITIDLNLSAGYVLTLLFGAIGVQLVRND